MPDNFLQWLGSSAVRQQHFCYTRHKFYIAMTQSETRRCIMWSWELSCCLLHFSHPLLTAGRYENVTTHIHIMHYPCSSLTETQCAFHAHYSELFTLKNSFWAQAEYSSPVWIVDLMDAGILFSNLAISPMLFLSNAGRRTSLRLFNGSTIFL